MVATKNGKEIKDLYPMKVIKADFVKVPNTNKEIGFGVTTRYNKDAKLLMGGFASVELLVKYINDSDGSTYVKKSFEGVDDRLSSKGWTDLGIIRDTFLKEKDTIFKEWKSKEHAEDLSGEENKKERLKRFKDAGIVITSKEDNEE